jgi:hypothetical protein
VLIPKSSNSAESLFVALLLRVLISESNDFISLVNVYKWGTFFEIINEVPLVCTVLVVSVNVPAKYKYVNTEIVNANNDLSPYEL